ncbi:hypothetical protein OE88DRAFT_1648457 [Heliocybe sulcata]|uniref:Fungal-type protein kinase domain-containing protein n=1 Tax=Heliocybe sulcata TaxID=5364 RepID=A0A5C3MQS3_9AGAM|nr:hypothetical protein OE88DRAFT_1648457 [Heliocybe sulcata]
MSDSDNDSSSALGSPAGALRSSLTAPHQPSEEPDLQSQPARPLPSPTPGPILEKSPSPSPPPASSKGLKGKQRVTSPSSDSGEEPLGTSTTSDAIFPQLLPRSLTIEMPDITTADQPSGDVEARPKVTKTYSGRCRTIAPQPEPGEPSIRPVTLAFDAYQAVEQLPGQETSVPPSLLDGSDLNPKTPVRGSRGALMIGDLDDTPGRSSSGSVISDSIGKLHNALRGELLDMWVKAGNNLLEKLNLEDWSALSAFFAVYRGYNATTQRWEGIPVAPKREKAIYEPLLKHINAIVHHFRDSTRRRAVDTHKTVMRHHDESGDTSLESKPDIVLLGTGPLISKEQHILPKASYAQCLAAIEVKTEKELSSDHFAAHRLQLATYARECFVQQPNRRFVYALLMSEESVILFQFDRGGAMYSRQYNIHSEPMCFIQIICIISLKGTNTRRNPHRPKGEQQPQSVAPIPWC